METLNRLEAVLACFPNVTLAALTLAQILISATQIAVAIALA